MIKMKNIFKAILLSCALISLGSCEDDIDPKVKANGFALRSPESGASIALQPQQDADTAVSINWDSSDNGGFTSVSNYKVEVAKAGTNFENALTANSGNNIEAGLTYAFTVKELNTLVNQMPGYACGTPMQVDIRVKSTLGEGYYNSFTQYSSTVTVDITPYSAALPTLAFATSATITDATSKLASSAVLATDYEGYMWLEAGTYFFYKPDACLNYSGATQYGVSGVGTLAAGGAGYVVLVPGYYYVKADTTALTYSVTAATWAVYGAAKQAFPQANSAMTYDAVSKTWKISISLATGYEFRFRTTNNATILGKFRTSNNYVGPDLSYYASTETTNATFLNVPGNKTSPRTYNTYDVVLDLSTPRDYKFTISQQP